jgi:hypothetical protein
MARGWYSPPPEVGSTRPDAAIRPARVSSLVDAKTPPLRCTPARVRCRGPARARRRRGRCGARTGDGARRIRGAGAARRVRAGRAHRCALGDGARGPVRRDRRWDRGDRDRTRRDVARCCAAEGRERGGLPDAARRALARGGRRDRRELALRVAAGGDPLDDRAHPCRADDPRGERDAATQLRGRVDVDGGDDRLRGRRVVPALSAEGRLGRARFECALLEGGRARGAARGRERRRIDRHALPARGGRCDRRRALREPGGARVHLRP